VSWRYLPEPDIAMNLGSQRSVPAARVAVTRDEYHAPAVTAPVKIFQFAVRTEIGLFHLALLPG